MSKEKIDSIQQRMNGYFYSIDAMLKLLAEAGLAEAQVAYLELTRKSLGNLYDVWQEAATLLVEQQQRALAGTKTLGKILVVDDDLVQRILVKRTLERFGYHVAEAADGEEAVAEYKKGGYNLIFLDCQMPKLDGFEVTKVIRDIESSGGEHIPIVAFTSNKMAGYQERCKENGMDDYLKKPSSAADIAEKVRVWIK